MSYQVFTSYAVADRTVPMERFMKAFAEALRRVLGGTGTSSLVFHDYVNILGGTKWKEVLSAAACESRMLVCLVSPTYFMRSWCGRELEIFHRRLELWRRLASKEERETSQLIFPIFWEPETTRPLPRKLEELQFFGSVELGVKDGWGLYDLAEKRGSAKFNRFVATLAKSIKRSRDCGHELPAVPVENLELLPSAFDEVRMPYDIHLWMATDDRRQWQPTSDATKTVAEIVEEAARAPAFVHGFAPQRDLKGQLSGFAKERQVLLVVADATRAPDATLAALNRLRVPAGHLLLLLVDPKARANTLPRPAAQWLKALRAKGSLHEAERTGWAVSCSAAEADLRAKADLLMESARDALRKRDRGSKVTSAKLERGARRQGIDTAHKSTLGRPA